MSRKIAIGVICGIVLIIIGVFIVILASPVQGRVPYHARDNVSTIEVGLERYLTDNGKLPPSSENYVLVDILSGNPEEGRYIDFKESELNQNREIIDHWKTPLRIIFHSDQSFSVRSAGPDRVFGTEDDAQFD